MAAMVYILGALTSLACAVFAARLFAGKEEAVAVERTMLCRSRLVEPPGFC